MPIECRSTFSKSVNFFSLILYLAPAWLFYKVCRQKSTGHLSVVPFVLTLPNCMLWIVYGLPIVHPYSILVTEINGAGFVLESIYVTIFIIYSNRDNRVKLLKLLAGVAVIFSSVVVPTIMLAQSHERRSSNVRILCCIAGIIMYCSPVYDIVLDSVEQRSVIRGTKRVIRNMPFFISLANFFNASTWTAYSYINYDKTLLIPNAIGALVSAVEVILYVICKRIPLDEDYLSKQLDDDSPSQPLLQGNIPDNEDAELHDREDHENADLDNNQSNGNGDEDAELDDSEDKNDIMIVKNMQNKLCGLWPKCCN